MNKDVRILLWGAAAIAVGMWAYNMYLKPKANGATNGNGDDNGNSGFDGNKTFTTIGDPGSKGQIGAW